MCRLCHYQHSYRQGGQKLWQYSDVSLTQKSPYFILEFIKYIGYLVLYIPWFWQMYNDVCLYIIQNSFPDLKSLCARPVHLSVLLNLWQTLTFLIISKVLPFSDYHIVGIIYNPNTSPIQYVAFSDWLLRSKYIKGSSVMVSSLSLSFLITKYTVWMYHSIFIHLPTEGLFVTFKFL